MQMFLDVLGFIFCILHDTSYRSREIASGH